MFKLLARVFIKSEDVSNPTVRRLYGELCGILGIIFSLVLVIIKLFAGFVSNSISIIGDAVNNLSDVGSSLVTLLGFKLSAKKPDKEHPFGHGRLEYVAGLVVSFLILALSFELLKSSVSSIIKPKTVVVSNLTLAIIFISILIKIYMFSYAHYAAKKIKSPAMEATAKDYLNDILSTVVVLVSIILSRLNFTKIPVDGIAGVFVAVFVFKSGIEAAGDTISPILGKAPSSSLIKKIEKVALSNSPIIGVHDIVVHDYGPGKMMITLDAEVPGNQDIYKLHDVIDKTEQDIRLAFNCDAVIHMDPVNLKSEELKIAKKIVLSVLEEINPELSAHDIRLVKSGKRKKLVFEVTVPFSYKNSDGELIDRISEKISSYDDDYSYAITIEKPYASD